MSYLHNDVYDFGLTTITDQAAELYICADEPTTYAEATSTYALGKKDAPAVGSPGARGAGGRQVAVTAFTDGAVTSTNTATYYAMVGSAAGSKLLVVAALSGTIQVVTSGNTFSLAKVGGGNWAIGIPAPA